MSFKSSDSNVFGHEFGHIIQSVQQGWASFQGRGIYEQILNSFFGVDPYNSLKYNEGTAEYMLQSVGGCTVGCN